MLNVSEEYIEQMNKGVRNRGHIRVTIGMVDREAQKTSSVDQASLAYYSKYKANQIFSNSSDVSLYASDEDNFTKVDGSMYFAPVEGSVEPSRFYYNGATSDEINGSVTIRTHNDELRVVNGLTIDFGEAYPLLFTITTNNGTTTYENDSSLFITYDVFDGVNFFTITPIEMIGESQRLRVFSFTFGITEIFTDNKVIECSITDAFSPISESLPSRDMTIKIDNKDQHYSPDNPDNVMSFMKEGQLISVAYGYDLDEDGNSTEWLEETDAFLSNWSADTSIATITAKDRLNTLTSRKFYDGLFMPEDSNNTLHQFARWVLEDANVEVYELDESLKNYRYAPALLPVVSHAEALQMIANASMCTVMINRSGEVVLKAVHSIPDITPTANGETSYSNVSNIILDGKKDAYAHDALNFTRVDGSMFFATADKFGGYYSVSVASGGASVDGNIVDVTNCAGVFVDNTTLVLPHEYIDGTTCIFMSGWSDTIPTLTLTPEEETSLYGVTITFRELYATEITIRTYDGSNDLIGEFEYVNDSLVFEGRGAFENFSKMEIVFTDAPLGSRIVIDKIDFDFANYYIDKSKMKQSPNVSKQPSIKAVDTIYTTYYDKNGFHPYSDETPETEEIAQRKILINVHEGETFVVEYDYGDPVLIVLERYNPGELAQMLHVNATERARHITYTIKVLDENAYGQTLTIYEYGFSYKTNELINTQNLLPDYYIGGEIIKWNNPLVATEERANIIGEWLADYYKGDTVYNISWRGDPRIEVGDLINIESTIGKKTLVRIVQNTLTYNGAWSGSFQARKVEKNVVDNS